MVCQRTYLPSQVGLKTLVLGLGNPILSDDSVGIKIARKLKEAKPELEVIDTCEAGLTILEYVAGCNKLIIIDSIKDGRGKPGELYQFSLEDFQPATAIASSHGLDIATVLKVGRELGYKMPESVSIYGVEIKDNTTFGEECTAEVEQKIPSIIKQITRKEKL